MANTKTSFGNTMSIQITALVENTVERGDFLGENGLSILIKYKNNGEKQNILIDTGQNIQTFLHNSKLMKIDLKSIDTIILSHGHKGHINTIIELLTYLNHPKIILHPGIFNKKFKKKGQEIIEIPTINKILLEENSELIISENPVQINEAILTTGEIPLMQESEILDDKYLIQNKDKIEVDSFREETSLIIKSSEGLIIITSCAHRGIINTIMHAKKITGIDKINGIIGGMHLKNNPAKAEYVAKKIFEMNPRYVAPCHCTGVIGKHKMLSRFNKQFLSFTVGDILSF